jgi:ferritin
MLISDRLNDAFNRQVGSELGASNQYLHVAAYFESEALPALSAFFYRQSDEEREHAMKFVHYLGEAGGILTIPGIPAPPAEIKSAEEAVKMCLEWELEVTKQINALMDIAVEEKDYLAQEFLGWFVTEQLEEVGTMDEILTVVRRAGDQLFFVEKYIQDRGDPHTGGEAE